MAVGKAITIVAQSIVQGAEKATEKAVAYAGVYIKGLVILIALSVTLPVPFLIIGISTNRSWLTALTGLLWLGSAALVFVAISPLGILVESINRGTKGSIARFAKLLVAIISTGLYVSVLFSIIPISTNFTHFPLLIVVLVILGLLSGWLFNKKLIVVLATIVFAFLLFMFILPTQHERLVNVIDKIGRPTRVELTFELTQEKDFAIFRSNGKNNYWYSISPEGQYEVFDGKGRHPITNAVLLPLDERNAVELMKKLKQEYEQKKLQKEEMTRKEEKERALAAEELRRHDMDQVLAGVAKIIVLKISGYRQRNLAVLPFAKKGTDRVSELGLHLSSDLLARVRDSGRVPVIGGSTICGALAELGETRLSSLNMVQTKSLKELADTDFLVHGTIRESSKTVEMEWALMSVTSAKVVASGIESINKDPDVTDRLNQTIDPKTIFPGTENAKPLADEKAEVLIKTPLSPNGSAEPSQEHGISLAAKKSRVINFVNKQVKVERDSYFPPSRWQALYDNSVRLQGYFLVEVNGAIIEEDTVTLVVTWTNFTQSKESYNISKIRSGVFQRPFLRGRLNRDYFCSSFEPNQGTQLELAPRIPVTWLIIFPNTIRTEDWIDKLDLYIQIWGKPDPEKYVVIHSLNLSA